MNKIHFVWLSASLAMLTACAAPSTLYHWGEYQEQVHQYFKNESPEKQLTLFEKDMEVMRSKGMKAPPGYHAHIGMLYSQTGQNGKAIQHFNIEKNSFPESIHYIDFLMNNMKK
jgi:hypothetical protein